MGFSEALEKLRADFLHQCPDFVDFQHETGLYFDNEQGYKDDLIHKAEVILSGSGQRQPEQIGHDFLKLVQSSNFVGWRVYDAIANGGANAQQVVEQALGDMLLSKDVPAVAAEAAGERIHPILFNGLGGKPAFSMVRSLVTSSLALARPAEAISIKTRWMQRAVKSLTGKPIFKQAVLTANEYQSFLNLSFNIHGDLVKWGWKPRDLGDVQGFLWVVAAHDEVSEGGISPAQNDVDEDEEVMANPQQSIPLNRILYGPPGTGKTWRTAQLAVEICNGSAPSNRDELMKAYNELLKSNRVTFTTFHQSIGYEEFVEGLRPVTDSDEESEDQPSSGFRLESRNGIFRDICALAEQARKRGGKAGAFDFVGRQFFKMSLGRASTEGHIYQAALEGNYIVLGWGGNVDWTDAKYQSSKAVGDRWKQEEPGASANSGHISQVWRFRSSMKKGDIVIVSDGNLRFRAIGEVTGDYQFQPQNEGGNHRRSVKWLRVLDESLPVDLIHKGNLCQVSCYLLTPSQMKLDALADLITIETSDKSSTSECFVLIIDEINRAHVSKVFGELITLVDEDKRLGATNAITVTLPYSKDVFGVPNNLYIIGTMNTADRSIALLDTALRRRFDFEEMMPDYECLRNKETEGIHVGKLLSAINNRVEWLFDRDHQIGHSYFIKVENKNDLDMVMKRKIIPLLAEYFYEDWEKVRAALNDTGNWFVTVEKLNRPALLKEGEARSRYRITEEVIDVKGYLSAIAANELTLEPA